VTAPTLLIVGGDDEVVLDLNRRAQAELRCEMGDRQGQELGWAIIDEAYQMRSDMLLLIADRFERALFVGDPGQLERYDEPDWTTAGADAITTLRCQQASRPEDRIWLAPHNQTGAA
jgi:hypothetical protein